MKITPYLDLEAKPVVDPAASGATMRIAIGPDDGAPNFVMRVFTVEPGGHSPRHSHPYEHEVFFHAGNGELFCEGETHSVGPGHVAFVPPGSLHQFRNTGSEPLVFVCVVPRPDK
jgi:quercetin dioxygenase-like cupin family protein